MNYRSVRHRQVPLAPGTPSSVLSCIIFVYCDFYKLHRFATVQYGNRGRDIDVVYYHLTMLRGFFGCRLRHTVLYDVLLARSRSIVAIDILLSSAALDCLAARLLLVHYQQTPMPVKYVATDRILAFPLY